MSGWSANLQIKTKLIRSTPTFVIEKFGLIYEITTTNVNTSTDSLWRSVSSIWLHTDSSGSDFTIWAEYILDCVCLKWTKLQIRWHTHTQGRLVNSYKPALVGYQRKWRKADLSLLSKFKLSKWWYRWQPSTCGVAKHISLILPKLNQQQGQGQPTFTLQLGLV